MPSTTQLPSLSSGWEPTRKTLHFYAQAIGVIPRAHATFHPKWWHISLKVVPDGLVTDEMPLPDGGTFRLKMDLAKHQVVLSTSDGAEKTLGLTEGLTSTEFGDRLLGLVAALGLEGEYAREKYQDDSPREYNPDLAERFFAAISMANQVFEQYRSTLQGEIGPVQFWPHGFDLAFEWFGTRIETYEEQGESTPHPSQLNLGFSPGDDENAPYFFSNPWPFEADLLLNQPLPEGARWFNEGWQGTILPYGELAEKEHAAERLQAYARTVYELAAPTLQA